MTNAIPFVNLGRQIEFLRSEIDAAIAEVIDSRAFISGPYVKKFECEFAQALNVEHAIGCSNGTAALSLALDAAGIGRGDEVITVANTFIATAEAICHVGATPVFVDVIADDYTIDPAQVEDAITGNTRAIIPVHLYGTPCQMDELASIASRHNLQIIEDCAQAHMARFDGHSVGTFGVAGTFSFYPGKNLGAMGDAGAIVSQDRDFSQNVRKLIDHGRLSKYEHDIIGYNHRMDGIQAAILSAKLGYLAEWTQNRRRNAKAYNCALKKSGFKIIEPSEKSEPVYHLYVVEVSNRDEVAKKMAEAGIGTGVHYPLPLHKQPAFNSSMRVHNELTVTEKSADRIISLPMCGSLLEDEVQHIIDTFLEIAHP